MMKRLRKKPKGQAMVEYIIIVVIVAIAALTVMGFFSDTIRQKVVGVINVLGGENASEAEDDLDTGSTEKLQGLQSDGQIN